MSIVSTRHPCRDTQRCTVFYHLVYCIYMWFPKTSKSTPATINYWSSFQKSGPNCSPRSCSIICVTIPGKHSVVAYSCNAIIIVRFSPNSPSHCYSMRVVCGVVIPPNGNQFIFQIWMIHIKSGVNNTCNNCGIALLNVPCAFDFNYLICPIGNVWIIRCKWVFAVICNNVGQRFG